MDSPPIVRPKLIGIQLGHTIRNYSELRWSAQLQKVAENHHFKVASGILMKMWPKQKKHGLGVPHLDFRQHTSHCTAYLV